VVIPKNSSGNGALVTSLLSFWDAKFKRTGKRNGEIFLASKFGVVFDSETGVGSCGDREYIRELVERLGVDMIGLYYFHR
jgi:aryl-alcohol dehydrogenase-like predicted oxidoreductase